MPDLQLSVHAEGSAPARTAVTARHFAMTVDEPPGLGGGDAGPNPVEYMLAALAGCLNVVGHMVASEMGISLGGLRIRIGGPLNTDKLMGKPEADRAGFRRIDVTLTPGAAVDPDTLNRWLRTVESRCPVSDNLSAATPVYITLG